MSKREKVQQQLVDFLNQYNYYFTAPYGILDGMEWYGRGKIRVISFGVARYLDATIKIIQPNKILLMGEGPLAKSWEISHTKTFDNAQDLIEFIKSSIHV